MRIAVELSPGDFLDRYAVLRVKFFRFSEENRAKIAAEYWRFDVLARPLLETFEVYETFNELYRLHDETFLMMERAVPAALNGEMEMGDHVAAIRLNKKRIALRQRLDALLGAEETEVKSYYGG